AYPRGRSVPLLGVFYSVTCLYCFILSLMNDYESVRPLRIDSQIILSTRSSPVLK
ncbi:unnamed protein product, partial [Arabidopsis halleri]